MNPKAILFPLSLIVLTIFTTISLDSLRAQTGDPELDSKINNKTLTSTRLAFGYSQPTSNNKLILNDGSITINYLSAGWFKDDGSHTTSNPNYIAGFCSNSFRNFISFDLSAISAPITTAVLEIQKFTSVPNTGYVVWEIFQVTTPWSQINMEYSFAFGNLAAGQAIYEDLGSGIPFGNDTIDGNLSSSTIISIPLTNSAIDALNAAVGGTFVLGGKADVYLPHLPPNVSTISATNIQNTGATLNGTVNPNGIQTSVSFLYGTSSGNLSNEVQAVPNSINGNTYISTTLDLNGLSPNTTYFFKVKATNLDLITVYGSESNFTTTAPIPPDPPVVISQQSFCANSIVADLEATPPPGCVVQWYEFPATGIPLQSSLELINGQTYYAESFNESTGLSSLTRSAVNTSVSAGTYPAIYGTAEACRNSESILFTTEAGMTDYHWDVSSGGTIINGGGNSDNYISVTWNTTGSQSLQVNYTDINGCRGSAPAIFPVDVLPLPVPTITGNSLVCAGIDEIRYGTEKGMTDYEWIISDGGRIISGGNSLSDSVMVIWEISGNQSVHVNYTNLQGCRSAVFSTLQVLVGSGGAPTISGEGISCAGTTEVSYSTEPGMNNYIWTISQGGIITSGEDFNTVYVTWETPGDQSISVNYTNPSGCGGVNSAVFPVTVNDKTVPGISGPSELCFDQEKHIYSTEPGMRDYVWTISEGGIIESGIGTDQIMVIWRNPGQQEITINYSNNDGCKSESPTVRKVFIERLPDSATVVTGNHEVCAGASGIYFSISPLKYAERYNWILPEGATILSGEGTHSIVVNFSQYSQSGEITVYGENLCGSGGVSEPFIVAISPLPGIPEMISGPDKVCNGKTIATYSIPPVSDATEYNWSLPDGVLILNGAKTNKITVFFSPHSFSGIISVYGINDCGDGNDVTNMNVVVNETPEAPEISLSGDLLTSSFAYGNQWYRNGEILPGATGQQYQISQSGRYWAVVATAECSSDTSNNIEVILTGINDKLVPEFKIFPVPNNGKFSISALGFDVSNTKLRIYNSLGVEVYDFDMIIQDKDNVYQIDCSGISSGSYIVVLQNDKIKQVKNMVVFR